VGAWPPRGREQVKVQLLHHKFVAVGKLSECSLPVEKLSSKNAKFGAKTLFFRTFKSQIGILSIDNLFCWKFATSCFTYFLTDDAAGAFYRTLAFVSFDIAALA